MATWLQGRKGRAPQWSDRGWTASTQPNQTFVIGAALIGLNSSWAACNLAPRPQLPALPPCLSRGSGIAESAADTTAAGLDVMEAGRGGGVMGWWRWAERKKKSPGVINGGMPLIAVTGTPLGLAGVGSGRRRGWAHSFALEIDVYCAGQLIFVPPWCHGSCREPLNKWKRKSKSRSNG